MSNLPDFTSDGVLPPGEYPLTLDQLEESILVLGPGAPNEFPYWDPTWRQMLVRSLRLLVTQLWKVGIDQIFIDGSFAENKDHPNDIDGYFECEAMYFASGRLEHDLNLHDPAKCWNWDPASRRAYRGYPKLQLPMWHTYRVELYPHYPGAVARVDELGQPVEFPALFRKCRVSNRPKGIVKIIK